MVYTHAKFEVSSFNRSLRYGVGPKILKVCHVTPSILLWSTFACVQ